MRVGKLSKTCMWVSEWASECGWVSEWASEWVDTGAGEEYGGVEVPDDGGDGGGRVDAGLRAARPRLQRAQHHHHLPNTITTLLL